MLVGRGAARLGLYGAVLILMAGALLGQAANPAFAAAPPKPFTDWSFYVRTTSVQTFYTTGHNQGAFDHSAGSINSEVVLDFGGQNSDNTGTLLTGLQTYVSYGTIASLADNFALGYYNGTGSDHSSILKLAIGTNNSAYHIDTAGGNAWAGVVNNVSNWVDNVAHIGGQVFIGGANDMETLFDTYAPTKSWVDAFSAAGPSYYLNYGDPTNCPSSTHTNGSCGTTGWNQDDVWYVSWGATIAFATPQIYYQNQANQWGQINLWKSMGFEGPLDEHDLNSSTFDSLPAWNALWGTTLGDPPFSLQIHLLT